MDMAQPPRLDSFLEQRVQQLVEEALRCRSSGSTGPEVQKQLDDLRSQVSLQSKDMIIIMVYHAHCSPDFL